MAEEKTLLENAASEFGIEAPKKEKNWGEHAGEFLWNLPGKALSTAWNLPGTAWNLPGQTINILGGAFNATKDAVQSAPQLTGLVLDQKNKDAWVKQPSNEQLKRIKSLEEKPEYKTILDSLGGLNNAMTTATFNSAPQGAGAHNVATVIYDNTNDLNKFFGKVTASFGTVFNNMGEYLGGIGNSAKNTFSKMVEAFQKDGFPNGFGSAAKSVLESVKEGGSALSSFFTQGLPSKILEERVEKIKLGLEAKGFTPEFSVLVATEVYDAGLKKIEVFNKNEQFLAKLKEKPTIQNNTQVETNPAIKEGAKELAQAAAKDLGTTINVQGGTEAKDNNPQELPSAITNTKVAQIN